MPTRRIRGDPLLIEPIQKIQEVESPVPLCERLQGKMTNYPKEIIFLIFKLRVPTDVSSDLAVKGGWKNFLTSR